MYVRGLQQEAPHLTLGTIIHSVLERYHKGHSKDLMWLLDTEWQMTDLVSLELYREARDMMDRYAFDEAIYGRSNVAHDKDGPIVERYFRFPVDDNGEVILSGIIDRIDEIDDTRAEVIDYKTNRQPFTREELDNNIQASIYLMALKKLWPQYYESDKVSFIFLRGFGKLSTTRTDEDLELAKHFVINTFYQIKNTDEPKPKLNKYCTWCPIKKECPAFTALTKDERALLGDIDTDGDIANMIDSLENVKIKQKILDDVRQEIETALKNHIEVMDKDHLLINGKKVYMSGQKRSFYPYDAVERIIGPQAKSLASISNEKVEKAVANDKEKLSLLEKVKVTYYTRPSLKIEDVNE